MSRLLPAISDAIEQIKINAVSRAVRPGRRLWIKRRRWFAGPVLTLANAFFGLAKSPVRALGSDEAWQRWEVETFDRLHGPEFGAFPEGGRGVAADELPGINVTRLLDAGLLTPPVCEAVGRELRRAHEQSCGEPPRRWSHGDPHAGNFIYDEDAQRARLIDFEVWHLSEVAADLRQLDDVVAFLQDLLGRDGRATFLANALAFLEGYGRPEIASTVASSLDRPSGFAGLWWRVRTSFLPAAQINPRITALRARLLAGAGATQ